jgi:rhomboid protease GluP
MDGMSGIREIEWTPGAWETFLLAACAPLGQFRQVHLAPRFPPGRLNLALQTDFPLLENELLLALIDSDKGEFQSVIVLTSRRVYWSTLEAEGGGGLPRPLQPRAIRSYGMDYAQISGQVEVESSGRGKLEIGLGSGRSLTGFGADARLGEALASFLRAAASAARTGVVPPLSEQDPELAGRIARVLPRVHAAATRVRALNRDLRVFRRDLFAATPRAWVTPLLTMACFLVYVVMVFRGVDPILPTSHQLLGWGANSGLRVMLRDEYWRLLASVFIHGGLIHLAINMWCLYSIGPLVERLFGNLSFGLLYLASGIGGAIASMTSRPDRPSVGASGAIFGMFGALLAFLIVHRRSVPGTVLKPLRSSALGFIVFNTLFAAVAPMIDQAAHLGGLATGFVAGLILVPPWPAVQSTRRWLWRLALGAALGCALVGLATGMARWRQQSLPPAVKLDDFTSQIEPAYNEIIAIATLMPVGERVRADFKAPESRERLSQWLHVLHARGTTNLNRLTRVTTPDPDLQAIRQVLVMAQLNQLAAIDSALKNRDSLEPQLTVLSSYRIELAHDLDAFHKRWNAFKDEHGLTERSADPPS